MDDKIKKIIYIVIGCFIIIFIFLLMISSCKSTIAPKELEELMVEKTENYYTSHKEELPGIGTVISLSLNDLVNKGIIDSLDNLLDSNTNCSGNVIIENNNNYYMYSPSLNCASPTENFTTNNLKEVLLNKVITEGSGLYNVGSEYIFKGDTINNYIMFDGLLWRIVKINSDGTIKLIENSDRTSVPWDNRYNADKSTTTGYNSYVYNGLNSRIKNYLEEIYNGETILSNKAKGYIKPTSLCVGKRALEETNNTGNIECSETIENQYLGLLQVNEYLNASLDPSCIKATGFECTNFNYLAEFTRPYWTITATNENNYQVYKVSRNLSLSNAGSNAMARIVINLSENTNVSGEGSKEKPYVVSGFSSDLKELDS